MGWQVQATITPTVFLLPATVPASAIVQAASGSSAGTTASATFANPVTPGNSVICGVQGANTSTPALAPSSGPDAFTTDSGNTLGSRGVYFYHKSKSAGGYTAVNVTLGGGAGVGTVIFAFEVPSTITYDTTATSSGTPWSFTYTPAVAAEFLIGLAISSVSGHTLTTPPAAPWTNEPVQTSGAEVSGSYAFTSTTSPVTFSGAWSAADAAALEGVAGYKLTYQPATPTNGCILYYYQGQLFALGESGTPVVLATT